MSAGTAVAAWLGAAARERGRLEERLGQELQLTKIHSLLVRQAVSVPYRTLHRFCVQELGFGRQRHDVGAPVIAATRLRGGNAASARGAASFATQAVHTARATGCSGIVVVRADCAFYAAAFTSAVRAAGACFSVTVQMNPHVKTAICAIGEDA